MHILFGAVAQIDRQLALRSGDSLSQRGGTVLLLSREVSILPREVVRTPPCIRLVLLVCDPWTLTNVESANRQVTIRDKEA